MSPSSHRALNLPERGQATRRPAHRAVGVVTATKSSHNRYSQSYRQIIHAGYGKLIVGINMGAVKRGGLDTEVGLE